MTSAQTFDPAQPSANLHAALRMADAGIPVFPAHCFPNRSDPNKWDKEPLVKGWRQLATTDVAMIRAWWARHPNAVPGIECGRAGLLVLDGDRHGRLDGVSELQAIARENGGLPPGPVTETAGNGVHLFFRQPSEGEPLGNREGLFAGREINVRGSGGWVVAPGAVRSDGKAWSSATSAPDLADTFENGSIPFVPEWVVRAIRGPSERQASTPAQLFNGAPVQAGERERAYALSVFEAELQAVASESSGGRNNRLNQAAFATGTLIGSGWLPEDDVLAALERAAAACGLVRDDGAHGVRKTIESGLRAGFKSPREPLKDHPGYGLSLFSPPASKASVSVSARPGELIPLAPPMQPAERYPLEALGSVLGRAAAAIARKVQVPESIAGQSVLAAAGLAAQAFRDVRLPYGQTRPLSLFFITIAESGDRKSSADHEALWPIRKREQALREAHEADFEDWKHRSAAHAAQRRKIEADKKFDLAQRTNELRALGPEPRRPLEPILTVPDPTVEGLAKAWANSPGSLGLFSAEGGAFFGGHGMSQDHKLKTAATLSDLWDGSGIRRMRAGDGLLILPGRRLACHLMAQPEAAAAFFADPILRGQGFHSRFLTAGPESMAGSRFYREPKPEDDSAIRAYGARLLALLEATPPLAEGKPNELVPTPLNLSAGAASLWKGFFDHVEAQCGREGDLASIKSFGAKAAENAARIAGVLAVVEDLHCIEVSETIMGNAIDLMNWYVSEALRLAGQAALSPALAKAVRLLEWMQSSGKAEFQFREILQSGPNPVRNKGEAEAAIKILLEHGQVVETLACPRTIRLVSEGA
jgi:hypothetical protein